MKADETPMTIIWHINEFLADWDEEYKDHLRTRQLALRQADSENGDELQGFDPTPPRGPRPPRSAFYRNMTKRYLNATKCKLLQQLEQERSLLAQVHEDSDWYEG
eukprot:2617120-Prorocentrum_lima.AAC.1